MKTKILLLSLCLVWQGLSKALLSQTTVTVTAKITFAAVQTKAGYIKLIKRIDGTNTSHRPSVAGPEPGRIMVKKSLKRK
jgi:hypothetical protein